MKYSSTPRLINTILFGILAAGFGFLGIYFGFFVSPFLWITPGSVVDLPETGAVALFEMIAAFGLAEFLMSLVGLVTSVKSLLKGNDDNLVMQSFLCYIGIGYILAALVFLNGIWLYRLTSTNFGFNNLGFVIVAYLIVFILLMVATNVPLVKLLGEEEDGNKTMKLLSGALGVANCGLALAFFGPFIRNLAYGDFTNSGIINAKYALYFFIPLAASALAIFAYLGYKKAAEKGETKKLNGFLFEGAIAVDGIAMIIAGALDYAFRKKNVSLLASVAGKTAQNGNSLEFVILSCIWGGLIVAGAIALVVITLFPPKAKAAKK